MNLLKSQKHKDGKKQLKNKEVSEQNIAEELAVYNAWTHVVGDNIAKNMQVFCVKVLSTFLRAAVPLNKLHSVTHKIYGTIRYPSYNAVSI